MSTRDKAFIVEGDTLVDAWAQVPAILRERYGRLVPFEIVDVVPEIAQYRDQATPVTITVVPWLPEEDL